MTEPESAPDSARAAEPASPARTPPPTRPTRPARADARRNRDKLVEAARTVFTSAGDGDAVPLEAVAREAGVGIGTLYRHFPSRETLVEAVYAAELDEVTESAPALLAEHSPELALRAWLDRYARFIATKRGMMNTLRAGWASGRIATPTTRERVTAAIAGLLAAGADSGTLRADVPAGDVTAMLLGVVLSTSAAADDPGQTERLLDLLVAALRPQP